MKGFFLLSPTCYLKELKLCHCRPGTLLVLAVGNEYFLQILNYTQDLNPCLMLIGKLYTQRIRFFTSRVWLIKSYPKTYKTHKKLDPNKEVLYNRYLISAVINKKHRTCMVNVYVLYLHHLQQMNWTLQGNCSRPLSARFMITSLHFVVRKE